jgi:hypothetical protein
MALVPCEDSRGLPPYLAGPSVYNPVIKAPRWVLSFRESRCNRTGISAKWIPGAFVSSGVSKGCACANWLNRSYVEGIRSERRTRGLTLTSHHTSELSTKMALNSASRAGHICFRWFGLRTDSPTRCWWHFREPDFRRPSGQANGTVREGGSGASWG